MGLSAEIKQWNLEPPLWLSVEGQEGREPEIEEYFDAPKPSRKSLHLAVTGIAIAIAMPVILVALPIILGFGIGVGLAMLQLSQQKIGITQKGNFEAQEIRLVSKITQIEKEAKVAPDCNRPSLNKAMIAFNEKLRELRLQYYVAKLEAFKSILEAKYAAITQIEEEGKVASGCDRPSLNKAMIALNVKLFKLRLQHFKAQDSRLVSQIIQIEQEAKVASDCNRLSLNKDVIALNVKLLELRRQHYRAQLEACKSILEANAALLKAPGDYKTLTDEELYALNDKMFELVAATKVAEADLRVAEADLRVAEADLRVAQADLDAQQKRLEEV